MDFTSQCFIAPKLGEAPDDCEDSIFPEPGDGPDAAKGVFAVSDGTTTSFFSGLWARILTRRFAADPGAAFDLTWGEWLKDAQQEWQAEVRLRAEAAGASFYTKNDVLVRKPGAATFVGLRLEPPLPDGVIPWRALVLGDSCLFILGKDGSRSMVLTKAEEFSNMVQAAESYEIVAAHLPKKFASSPDGAESGLAEGDVALLATDALSKWLLARAELGQPIWGTVLSLRSQSEFETFIADARREAEVPLDNDDVALVVVKLGTPHERYGLGSFEPKPKPEKPPTPSTPPPLPPPASDIPDPSPPVKSPGQKRDGRTPLQWVRRNRLPLALLASLIALVLVFSYGTRRAGRDKATIAAREEEIASLRTKLEQTGANYADLRREAASLRTQQAALAAKLAESEQQRTDLARQMTKLEQHRADLGKQLATTSADLKKEQEKLISKLANADREKTALAEQHKLAADGAQKRLDDANAKITQAEADAAALKIVVSELEQQIKELKMPQPAQVPQAEALLRYSCR